jgi:hypothetical protein
VLGWTDPSTRPRSPDGHNPQTPDNALTLTEKHGLEFTRRMEPADVVSALAETASVSPD